MRDQVVDVLVFGRRRAQHARLIECRARGVLHPPVLEQRYHRLGILRERVIETESLREHFDHLRRLLKRPQRIVFRVRRNPVFHWLAAPFLRDHLQLADHQRDQVRHVRLFQGVMPARPPAARVLLFDQPAVGQHLVLRSHSHDRLGRGSFVGVVVRHHPVPVLLALPLRVYDQRPVRVLLVRQREDHPAGRLMAAIADYDRVLAVRRQRRIKPHCQILIVVVMIQRRARFAGDGLDPQCHGVQPKSRNRQRQHPESQRLGAHKRA